MKSLLYTLLSDLLALSLLIVPIKATENVLARQDSNLIDPVQQPLCSGCWHWGPPPANLPGCSVVKSSCPNDENASDNMTGDENPPRIPKCGIYQYPRDCYCNLKTPISCAWHCNWEGWWQTEDWYAQVCPNAPATKQVDFSALPACARECLDDNTFQYGCLTQTSNCICSKGDLFDCHKKCGTEAEWDQISRWLQDTCAISEDTATEALKTGMFSLYQDEGQPVKKGAGDKNKESPPPLPGRRPFRWDEIFVLSAASLVGFTVVVLWVRNCIGRRGRSWRMGRRKVEVTSLQRL